MPHSGFRKVHRYTLGSALTKNGAASEKSEECKLLEVGGHLHARRQCRAKPGSIWKV